MDEGKLIPSVKERKAILRRYVEEQEEIRPRSGDHVVGADSKAQGSAADHDDRRRLLIHSAVLAVSVAALLSYSGGAPVLSGWTMSLFMVLYLFCCSCSFSTAATPLAKIFFALSYVGLIAFLAGTLVSGVLGMVLMYLDSLLAAGLFGSTLAEHRQSNGRERAAFVAVTEAALWYRNKQDVYVFLAVLALLHALGLAWTTLTNDANAVSTNLFGGIACLLCIQIAAVLAWLNGAAFGHDFLATVIGWFLAVAMLFFVSFAVAGELVAVTVLWLCVLASAAFLGYFLQVHASYEYYENIIIIRALDTAASTTDGSEPTTDDCAATTEDTHPDTTKEE